MGNLYSVGGFGFPSGSPEATGGTNVGTLCEIIAGPTDRPLITEIGFTLFNLAPAGPNVIGIGVPAAQGISPKGVAPGSYDPNQPSTPVLFATSWRVPPTAPASFYRRITTANAGATTQLLPLVLRFPRGLQMQASTSLVLYCIGAQAGFRLQISQFWIEVDT